MIGTTECTYVAYYNPVYHYNGIILIDDGVIATYINNIFTVTKINAIQINSASGIASFVLLTLDDCSIETINFDTFNAYNVKVTIPDSTIYRIYEFVFPTSYENVFVISDDVILEWYFDGLIVTPKIVLFVIIMNSIHIRCLDKYI